MLIAYDPMTDVLSITLQATPVAQTQTQGTAQVGFDAAGNAVSIAIANASTALWEHGGQINVLLPEAQTVVTETVVTQPGVVVEKRIVE